MVQNSLTRVWRLMVRVDVAAILIFLFVLAIAAGSLFPQVSPTAVGESTRLGLWQAALRTRYGQVVDFLWSAGMFRYFTSAWVLVPCLLIVVTTLACLIDRWPRVLRRVSDSLRHSPSSIRCSDTVFTTAPCRDVLYASSQERLVRFVTRGLEERGFRPHTASVGERVYLRADRFRFTTLATLVNHAALLLLLVGVLLSTVLGWKEELHVGLGETVDVGHATGLRLKNAGFDIQRHADGSAASYDAGLVVLTGDVSYVREVDQRILQINKPWNHAGLELVLAGYQTSDEGETISVLAVYDPGYSLVIVAGFSLLIGTVVVFAFPHCCVRARFDSDGAAYLSGRAGRYAWDFDREFSNLVDEIRRLADRVDGETSVV